MRRFDLEHEHYNPSDSESGMQPQYYREPCASVNPMVCSSLQEQYPCMQLPLAGLIYKCDTKTKRLFLKRRLIYMRPARQNWVDPGRMRPGAKLFIFDYEARMLWGTYEISTFPHFLIRRDSNNYYRNDDMPYQIFFQLYHMYEPLPEVAFKDAFMENYFTPNDFRFELNKDQVANLLACFRLHESYWRKPYNPVIQPKITERRRYLEAQKCKSFRNEGVSRCMQGRPRKKRVGKHKQLAELETAQAQLTAESKRTNSTSQFPQRIKDCSSEDELLQCNLKLGMSKTFLRDNNTACFQDPSEQDNRDSFISTPISLEDGEFVLPEDEKISCIKNRQHQELQQFKTTASVEEMDAEFQTRNFIEVLEHSLTSDLNATTIYSSLMTACDGETIEANDFDEASNLAQLQHQHIHVKNCEACEGALWIDKKAIRSGEHRTTNKFDKVDDLAELKHVRIKNTEASKRALSWIDEGERSPLRLAEKQSRIQSAELTNIDGVNKVKGSVWLRLADPRPVQADDLFADIDPLEQKQPQQSDSEAARSGTSWKEKRSCFQRSGSTSHFLGKHYSTPKVYQEMGNAMNFEYELRSLVSNRGCYW